MLWRGCEPLARVGGMFETELFRYTFPVRFSSFLVSSLLVSSFPREFSMPIHIFIADGCSTMQAGPVVIFSKVYLYQ